ncbi:Bis(5'-nucleosyl)-tetraphosphatase PrpE [asymmetrical] [Austwickia sp. TVS 96-490-7B]|uniref:metallophosphoesterase n=1 Tax=Austwickia sp. TVS 96-490-7B TaxID=2830843 RepID=UPI001D8CA654|nr:metallophosphoesterase [Austwickia sp. TVS 96-490-7B]MBW3086751.1 Bis(5'-nucleosyl)-tetraphosphatase PrpE [asymmetrical] [Austwickia sp. TVS 96-490-7B]
MTAIRPAPADMRTLSGPFDIIGDVHGCYDELLDLLDLLGYRIVCDNDGAAVDAYPPQGRLLVFVGDLVDRGPDSVAVLRLMMGMTAHGHAIGVVGNHEHKLGRALAGRGATPHRELAATIAALTEEAPDLLGDVQRWCAALPAHLLLDGGRLVVAHAGLREDLHGVDSGQACAFALYGDVTGDVDERGLPVRRLWPVEYRGEAYVIYGHTPTSELTWINRTLCLDTGCVFGGALSALRYPELQTVHVPARGDHGATGRTLSPLLPPS